MTVSLCCGNRFLVRLYENPSSGYSWHINNTKGLKVIDSWYAPSVPVRENSGGTHFWSIRAIGEGEQIFRAVYLKQGKDMPCQPIVFQLVVKVI